MESKNVILEIADHVATLTINRPESMNAINSAMMTDFSSALDRLENDETVHALIVTGGQTVFAAGADIKEISTMDTPSVAHAFVRKIQKNLNRLEALTIPVIASVNGLAFGGGCELALACDYRICSETARFALPEINLGLMPGAGGTQRLPRLIGPARAMEMLFSGQPISAETALAFGLVNKVAASDRMWAETCKLAELYSRKPRWAMKWIKSAVRIGMTMDISSALEYETRCFELLFSTKDEKEGVQAFIEKRKPSFSGC